MRLFEWHKATNPFQGDDLIRFNTYLNEVWENRIRYLGQSDAEQRRTQRFFNFTFDGDIGARNYVGVVQFEGRRIEVMPKIFSGRSEEVKRKWKYNLLYWLSYCRKIRFPFSIADLSVVDFDDFLELLIYLFAHYTEEVITNRAYQHYQPLTEELPFLKGRLVFDRYIQNNLSTGHWQHFTCEHQPFVFDNLLNRIIKYVTRQLLVVTNHAFNREKLQQILFTLDEVSDSNCIAADCDRVKLNALFSEHQRILELCRMYLSNQMIDTSSDDSNNFCFLIPMEYVFEDFIFGFLETHFESHRFNPQSTGYLAEMDNNSVFEIKNDIFIDGQLVIDTKYKIRPNDHPYQKGVSQENMYQMIAYALRRKCHSVVLLYPYHNAANNDETVFKVKSEKLKEKLTIKAANVDIIVTDNLQSTESILSQLENVLQLTR